MSDAAAHMGRLLVKIRRLAIRASSPADSPAGLDLSGLNKKWANPQKAPCHAPCPCPCPWLVRRTRARPETPGGPAHNHRACTDRRDRQPRAHAPSQPQRLSIEESNEE
ncbi:hypothetical protein F5144DRAFT_595045 [Chaetomium tenue]|uniref:Uncharacterized protein n=1 Tax=Chaetomium tenue TaxID=1854479 RepID=A0ACB7NXA8_9PEZI|nr:hypothetical protein F5144DRAFT_595045 [Chaetomium globosum]